MGSKSLWSSEILTGAGLIAMGLIAQAAGHHEMLAQAMAPFGVGLILSDALGRAGKAARERVKVRVRRDDE